MTTSIPAENVNDVNDVSDVSDVSDVNSAQRIFALIEEHRRQYGTSRVHTTIASAPVGAEQAEGADANGTEQAPLDLVVRGHRILVDQEFGAREIGVRDGRIVAIEPLGSELTGRQTVDLAEDEVLLPGLVDTHVHINEPGRTEWEGFASATRAAAAGGVTTVVDMPLNSIPSTVNSAALEYKQMHAAENVFVDIGFWGGAIPSNQGGLASLHEDGVFGFKCFLSPSGVEEFANLTPDQLEAALTEVSALGSLLIVHAEDPGTLDTSPAAAGPTYRSFLHSRPRSAENAAISEVIERTRATGGRAHILHLSSADALPMIAAAKREGLDLTVETCPHYLTLISEDIADGATPFKCCPPVRERDNREQLWQGLLDGTIDFIVSDHSPSTPALKDLDRGDFGTAWGGVSSLQLGLSLIWTEARDRGIGLEKVVEWMSTKPARRVGLGSKGRLAVGFDADFAVFAPEESFVVDAAGLHHRHAVTPYQDQELSGRTRTTVLRGRPVDFVAPRGRLLGRAVA